MINRNSIRRAYSYSLFTMDSCCWCIPSHNVAKERRDASKLLLILHSKLYQVNCRMLNYFGWIVKSNCMYCYNSHVHTQHHLLNIHIFIQIWYDSLLIPWMVEDWFTPDHMILWIRSVNVCVYLTDKSLTLYVVNDSWIMTMTI